MRMASTELVSFSTSAATGLDCWFSITPKLLSLPPRGCHSTLRVRNKGEDPNKDPISFSFFA